MGHQEVTIGREDTPPVKAHVWAEAPPTDTGRKQWWVVPYGTQEYVLVKRTHHMRLTKVGAPYEVVPVG